MEHTELPTEVAVASEIYGDLDSAESREVLITNGIGGYGSLTLANSLTRSYHGLLIAALRPPQDRTLLLSKLNETVTYLDRAYNLYTDRRTASDVLAERSRESVPSDRNQGTVMSAGKSSDCSRSIHPFQSSSCEGTTVTDLNHPEIVIPEDFKLPTGFHLEGTVPVFQYIFEEAIIEKRIWMKRGQNTVYVTYYLRCAEQAVRLQIRALVNYRNHHSRTSATQPGFIHSASTGHDYCSVAIRFLTNHRQTTLTMSVSDGQFELVNEWVAGFILSEERARGLPELDDHLHAVTFVVELVPGKHVTFAATAEKETSHISLNGEAELALHHAFERQLLQNFNDSRMTSVRQNSYAEGQSSERKNLAKPTSTASQQSDVLDMSGREDLEVNIRQLVLAADQFIISRGAGYSVMAGFHWFTDWTRDTMISLPGLTVATGRYEIARSILQTFSRYVSKGMLPNRFPDDGSAPTETDYNNVDGTLWFFEAVLSYYKATTDTELLQELYYVFREIIEHHCIGTRFGIKQDKDGLLQAGVEGLALTWMDAKTDMIVHTQRYGKPVEVAALWFNSLRCISFFASELGLKEESEQFYKMAKKTEQSFQKFWNSADCCCYDVIDGGPSKTEKDSSLRPNQLIAASLSWSPLTREQRALVLEVCARHLLTSNSIRSLSSNDKSYRGVYKGDVFSRDSSYHQGVGWTWLLGPFILANLRVHGDKEIFRQYMLPLLKSHLTEGGIGQVSELFDGDPPYRAKGCIAQAWSVAELLRAWVATEPDGISHVTDDDAQIITSH